jgi:hypothetical protein
VGSTATDSTLKGGLVFLVNIMQHRAARWIGVRLVRLLARATRGFGPTRAGNLALRAAGRIAAAGSVADDLRAGRCVRFKEALPGLFASWERDKRALGEWPPSEEEQALLDELRRLGLLRAGRR